MTDPRQDDRPGAAQDRQARPGTDPGASSRHLVQLFLPVYDNDGQAFPKALFDTVRAELTERFGGTTAFLRSPAVGAWEDDTGDVQRDDMVLLEVMADALDRPWWATYRRSLESRFAQDEILLRATAVEQL